MKTTVIKIDRDAPCRALLLPAAEALKEGGLVAFPTETVYGLGAVWNRPDAVRAIFEVKGRPQDNPLIVHERSVEGMKKYFAQWDEVADTLCRAFCPGPFTLIMKHRKGLCSPVTAGLDTIAVRVPEHPVSRLLIELCGEGVAAPSANISGRPSPTNAADALEDLDGKVPFIIDGGSCDYGVESSIVSWVDGKLELLRPGGISAEMIEECLAMNGIKLELTRSGAAVSGDEEMRPRAPGMKYRHYAPRAKVHVLSGADMAARLEAVKEAIYQTAGGSVSAFYISDALAELAAPYFEAAGVIPDLVLTFSEEERHQEAAKGLFAAFRTLDRLGANHIWAEEQELSEVGAAYMNRLLKAAADESRGPLKL